MASSVSNSDPTSDVTNRVALARPGRGFTLAILALFIVASLVFYLAYTSQRDAVADFFIEWKGSQVALQGGNPYSDETTRQIQLGSKGRLVGPEEDQLAFVYPYWRVFYSAPIAFLPYEWASAIWLGLLLAVYCGALYLLTLAQGWRPSTPLKGTLYYGTLILMFPAFSSLMLGQSALLGAALLSATYYCLKSGSNGIAGVTLALATVKPQLALVIVPWLLLRALWQRDWKLLAGFGITLAILAGLSFAFYPAWFSEFVTVASRYPSYKKSLTGPGFLLESLGSAGMVLSWLIWLVLLGIGLWLWWREIRSKTNDVPGNLNFDLAFSAALLLTLLLPPQTNISNPVILALPLTMLFARWDRSRSGAYYGLGAVILIGSWLLYFVLYNNFYGLLIVSWPLLMGLLLYLVYRPQLQSL
jgi:hypothetical protein